MSLLDRHLPSEITETDLQELVNQQERETKTLEFKLIKPSSDELRKDLSAFANTDGGLYIIGIEDEDGAAKAVPGIVIDSKDRFSQTVDNVMLSNVYPRINGIRTYFVDLANGSHAAIVHIPRSYSRPHQIKDGRDNFVFWARNDSGNYQLSLDQLRSLILGSKTLTEEIRTFRLNRLAEISTGQGAADLGDRPTLVMHLIPLDAFSELPDYDLSPLDTNHHGYLTQTLAGLLSAGGRFHSRYNFDGFVAFTNSYKDNKRIGSYHQFFRNGIMEYADAQIFESYANQGRYYWFCRHEEALVDALSQAITAFRLLGIQERIGVAVSLLGVRDVKIWTRNPFNDDPNPQFGKPYLHVPEQVFNLENADPVAILTPIFDAIWNAGGFAQCNHRDDTGCWKRCQ